MNNNFDIQPAKYDVPKIGFVNAFSPVSDETAFALYKLKRGVFPWIKPNENTLAFLKKQKPLVGDIAKMVYNAQTVDEVKMLLKLTESKTVARIAEVKLNSLNANLSQKANP